MPSTSLLTRRFVAFGIDLVPLACAGVALHLALAQRCVAADTFGSCAPDGLTGQITVNGTTWWTAGRDLQLEVLLMAAFVGAYRILVPGWCGSTLGGLLCGLRVVDATGRRATVRQHARRTAGLLLVDSAPYIVPGIAGITELIRTGGATRLGDASAGTRVVRRQNG